MNDIIKADFSRRTMIYDSKDERKEKNFIIAIIIDYKTKEVLMQAFMDEEAWNKTIETGFVHFYSFSRDKLWLKGETSGNKLEIKEMILDCDRDCVKINVKIHGDGKACHTGNKTCFFNNIINPKE
jgi:phosphoribosyl-AMP cyclohydrolase